MSNPSHPGPSGGATAGGAAAAAAPPRLALAGLGLSVALAALGTSMANVVLPGLAQALGVPFQAVQWVVLAYLLSTTALVVGAGRLGDRLGRRRVLLAGLVLHALGAAGAALSNELGTLVLARAAQGAGAAAMMALATALVSERVPRDQAGRAMGLLGTLSAVGTALGPVLGGVMLQHLGWQSVFAAGVPLALLAVWLVARHLQADAARPASVPGGLDAPGMIVLALTLVAYALAVTLGRGRFGALNLALLAAAAVGVGVFVVVERRATSPLVQVSMLRDRSLRAGLIATLAVSTVLMATLVVSPFYLALGLGLPPGQVGLMLAIGPLVAAVSGAPAGVLVDRLGAPRLTRAGLAAVAIGCLGLSMLPVTSGVATVVAYAMAITVTTAGYAVFQAANNTAVMAGGPASQRGLVSGLLNLSRNLGLISGASLMGAVFAAAAGAPLAQAGTKAIAAAMSHTFGLGTLLVLVALLVVQRMPAERTGGTGEHDASGVLPAGGRPHRS